MAIRSITDFCRSRIAPEWYQNISLRTKIIVILALGVIIARQTGLWSAVRSLMGRVTPTPPPSQQHGPKTATLFSFLNNVNYHAIPRPDIGGGRTESGFLKEFFGINGSLNRFKNTRRADLETEMINNIQTQLPDKKAKLRYLGTERGRGLLQDFINIGKLIRAGYEDIEAVLYDQYRVTDGERETLDELTEVAREREISLRMFYTTDLTPFKGEFHIIQVRDNYEFNLVFPFFPLHQMLESQGNLYLICDDWNFTFNSKGCTHKFFGKKTAYPIEELGASLEETAQKKTAEELKVAFLSDEFYLRQWVDLLPRMCKRESLKSVHLTLLPPQRSAVVVGSKYERQSRHPAFQSAAIVGKFLSLLCGKEVKVTYIDSPLQEESSNARFFVSELFKSHFDIIAFLFNYDTDLQLNLRVKTLQSEHPNCSLFFDLTAENAVQVDEDAPVIIPVSGSREEYPNVAWQGTWKWEKASGVTFIGNRANTEDQGKIRALMEPSDG